MCFNDFSKTQIFVPFYFKILTFEWRDLGYGASNFSYTTYRGKHYIPLSSSERNSYILSKIEELRLKGLNVSWFDKNKEKYLKMENKKRNNS